MKLPPMLLFRCHCTLSWPIVCIIRLTPLHHAGISSDLRPVGVTTLACQSPLLTSLLLSGASGLVLDGMPGVFSRCITGSVPVGVKRCLKKFISFYFLVTLLHRDYSELYPMLRQYVAHGIYLAIREPGPGAYHFLRSLIQVCTPP